MQIGELSRLTGVSIRSIRYYEKQGLIRPDRLENGYRVYNRLAVEQVRTIQLYLRLGLSTEEIGGFLHCVLQNKEAFCRQILPIYRSKLEEIGKQIDLLTMLKANLEERVEAILSESSSDQE
ncbi:MerR family transcriptional regulator [Paenibacillus aurantius]|uniref:MerR family transcriptional regulator n=1 Tax=Paenibacillus aurantius TaxID=2918900 RepID=A0AA96LF28_9BACL|nr:MerR family transcriptional regulator [Paenibacillus aurantius]WJH32186.1 MerR family transcriptional regulator [Paenibacillus sp. CC-CFT747]WNQ12561.1 MerR family transcriptional regulator [Paenibacillus aurantius]